MYKPDHLACTSDSTMPLTMAELRASILANQALNETQRRDIASALSCLGKALGRPLETIPADPLALRPMLAGLTPAMVGLKAGRWRNVLSLTSVALAHAGVIKVQGRVRTKPSSAWRSILDLLPTGPGPHFHMWRFARYCTDAGMDPAHVTDAVLAGYENDLQTHSLVSDPLRSVREVTRLWNQCADSHPGWPQQRLTIPDNRQNFSPPWHSLPDGLQKDVAAWCDWLGGADPFLERPFLPLKPASIESYRRMLRPYFGALLAKGMATEELVDLGAVVKAERLKLALAFFWERAGKKKTGYLYKIASMVVTIGQYWAKLPEAEIERLQAIKKQVRPTSAGMTSRNMSRLRQLDDPARLLALLNLPQLLMDKARRLGTPSVQAALLVQTAVAVELLIQLPMRFGNLRGLRIGVHLHRPASLRMSIAIPGDEVKNGAAINASLQSEVSKLIGLYLDRYRVLLDTTGGDWLFPGKKLGRPKTDEGLRTQVCKAIAQHCGIRLTPHLFRHFAAWLILRQNPSAHGQVQRVLGHKSLNTTMSFYSGLETSAALQHYDDLVSGERQKAVPATTTTKRRRPG